MTRKIKAHKGGRTARLEIRIKPETKAVLERFAELRCITMSDVIEMLAKEINLHLEVQLTICPNCKWSHPIDERCSECQYPHEIWD